MKTLNIFLSHKKGESERNAALIAGCLALFGRNVKVICSAKFDPGINWQHAISKGLDQSDWLILLYTGPHTEWDWCLFETGYFQGRAGKSRKRRLICLHDPEYPVPAPLRAFTSVPAREEKVYELFEDIYLKTPWRINPHIFRNNNDAVKDAAKRISSAARFGSGPKYNLRIAPLINIRIKKSEVPELEKGIIPASAPVTGEGGWETVFGKPDSTAGWIWGDLKAGIDKVSAWEYQICFMMADGIKRRSVQYPSLAARVVIKGLDHTQDIYRIGLGRISEFEDEFEFVFILFRLRTPFEPSESDKETMLYHLFNIGWHFRRRFIEHHSRKMEQLLEYQRTHSHKESEELKSHLAEAIRNIKVDLKALEAEAQVRGLDRGTQIQKSFEQSKRETLNRLLYVDWPPLRKKLDEAIHKELPQVQEIRNILAEMDPINMWFYKNSIAELNGLATGQ